MRSTHLRHSWMRQSSTAAASSGLRGAAIAKWSHRAFNTLVLARAVTELVWPARQSIDMQQMELLRDAIMEVFP